MLDDGHGRYTKGPARARRQVCRGNSRQRAPATPIARETSRRPESRACSSSTTPGEDAAGAALAAERLREAARQPFKTLADVDLTLTISLGVTEFRPELPDPTALLREADRALYASKQGGRNRVSVYR
jgi:hypothetical protein